VDCSPVRLLIADDDPDIRLLLRLALTRAGYEPHTVDSGASVLGWIGQMDFAACILDVRMPDISGLDVCRAIKTSPGSAHLPVMILSAGPDDGTSNAGFDDYITKPFELDDIIARIATLLSVGS
jgi:DNA-binding response OmpR family regulator